MLEIYFHSKIEKKAFLRYLNQTYLGEKNYFKIDAHKNEQLTISYQKEPFRCEKMLHHALLHLFLKFHFPNVLKKLIKKHFYYTNEEDIQRIISYCFIIFELDTTVKQSSTCIIADLFNPQKSCSSMLHIPSILTFQIPKYREVLLHIIERSIDEFKMEEEHQNFIETVRKFTSKMNPKMSQLHIIHNQKFIYYNENGCVITKPNLVEIIEEAPLYMLGLGSNEFNLLPIVALAPKQIYIYSEKFPDAKILTIMNIFLEKVILKPLSEFPFNLKIQQYSCKKI